MPRPWQACWPCRGRWPSWPPAPSPPAKGPAATPPDGQPPGEQPLGFVLLRAIAGEAEIISIGVRPEARRAGIGHRLMDAALAAAAAGGAEHLFLEVAADNWQALGLYLSYDFTEVGRRPNYYQRNGGGIMALVLSKPILTRAEVSCALNWARIRSMRFII